MGDTTTPLAYAQLVRRYHWPYFIGSRLGAIVNLDAKHHHPIAYELACLKSGASGNKTGTGRMEYTTNKCNDVAITFCAG